MAGRDYSLKGGGAPTAGAGGGTDMGSLLSQILSQMSKPAGQAKQAGPAARQVPQPTGRESILSGVLEAGKQPLRRAGMRQVQSGRQPPSRPGGIGTTAAPVAAGAGAGGGAAAGGASAGMGTQVGTAAAQPGGAGAAATQGSARGAAPTTPTETGSTTASPAGGTYTPDYLTYGAYTIDENEKLQRASRHLIEQQFEFRQNWMDINEKFYEPMKIGTMLNAYNKQFQNSELFEFASNELKGYLENTKQIWAGDADWDTAFDSMNDMTKGDPNDWWGNLEDAYKNADINPLGVGITTQLLTSWFPGIQPEILSGISFELNKWAGAILGMFGQGQR